MATMQIRLLGGFSLVCDDTPIRALTSERLQELFAYLILHREIPQTRGLLSYKFWPDSNETQARNNLRKMLYDLRHAFPDVDRYLELDVPELRVREKIDVLLDVEEFEHTAQQTSSVEALESAINLYQGEFMPGCYADWALLERQRLHQLFVLTLETLTDLLEDQRQYWRAIDYVQLLLQYTPLNEDAYRRLMRLHALKGDRAGVVRTFHACTTILQQELEIEPSQMTQEEYEHLLNIEKPEFYMPVEPPKTIGRNVEWSQLQEVWLKSIEGIPQWAVLSGEKGIGKTRLAEELLGWAASQGIKTARTQCYPNEKKQAYEPVVTLLNNRNLPPLNASRLTELARLLPEIMTQHPNLPLPGPLEETWQRHRFFEAISRVILANQPLILLVDDIQWCDPDTFGWLVYLYHSDPKASLLILSTFCPENLDSVHTTLPSIRTLIDQGEVREIKISPLTEAETAMMAEQIEEEKINPISTAWLYWRSKGNPNAILKMLEMKPSEQNQAAYYAEVLSWLEQSRAGFEKKGDLGNMCHILELLGNVYSWQSEYETAQKYYKEQLDLAQQIGDKKETSKALGNIGMAYWEQGDEEQALDFFEQQLKTLGPPLQTLQPVTNVEEKPGSSANSERLISSALSHFPWHRN
jgi:DNA-binding SARP family transcriptional activator